MSVAQIIMFACMPASIALAIVTMRINRQTSRIMAHTRRTQADTDAGILHHCVDCKHKGDDHA